MPLIRLIYFSENQLDPSVGSILGMLSQILGSSNRNNKPNGLTGALIFDNQWFFQALEGDREKVWQTFERIREDERHTDVVIAEVVDAETRVFANWWMGLATRNTKTEHVFMPFLHNDRLDPRRMTASQMLSLMVALSSMGLSRELAAPQAA